MRGAMECNVWMQHGTAWMRDYDEAAANGLRTVRPADGTERVLRPRHIVFANGIVGAPKVPELPGLEDFKGEVLHTHGYMEGAAWKGKNALVLGAGTQRP